ncbi:molecular chaperone HtpG [Sedimentibacter acidaminivorans]|uniref:Molecular chaperone HtpG n=1 Tax=Sedimentibacter acidaminivorans TaxID=913099 RepID=A0ABS4GDM6_9FIRM|nr:molecular chaperone HtpG [Sedimentibacter acidaminivorans]MBP1925811.1 molecular chaperone HtpG [Sedimentibacter acidaminivorans]
MDQKGMLSIESRNVFNILKKWLYTEQDIVFRELISNACDAIEKLSKIKEKERSSTVYKGNISVKLDINKNCLIISDNGIGMTEEEVQKYINQIAFSGATDFINNNNQTGNDTIIGHFGVGFYSSFMISDHVAIETKSYQENEQAVRWDCLVDMSFSMKEGCKSETGTDVILYLNDSSPYFKKPTLIFDIIKKYFILSKTEIYFEAPNIQKQLVNITEPIFRLNENLINQVEMNSFYREFFSDISDPLFWFKFESVDIGVKGILFFRNTKNNTEELDGKIKVFSKGVYIGENISELIPKFVNLQNGIIECDNLPLVVSRNSIREENSKENIVDLINECLSQEVTIYLNNMFEQHRDKYEAYWPNINAFVKYSILQDKIFASVMAKKAIFMDLSGKYYTINEYIEKSKNTETKEVYYSSDAVEQSYYIGIFKRCGLNALLFDHVIDQPFMRKYEVINPSLKFIRIDSNIEALFNGEIKEEDKENAEVVTNKIKKFLGSRLGNIRLKASSLQHESISILIINDEKSRRLADMMEIYGLINATDFTARELQSKSTLLINLNNDIVRFILCSDNEDLLNIIINQLFDLALLNQQALEPEDIESFVNRSENLLIRTIKK